MRRLVEALNACWRPHTPDAAEVTLTDFKRDIRERHVWCSSCMIAFEGTAPIGVLIGAKRPTETLVDRIAVRPDLLRQGHGRHMLDSLGAKLTILGPPRLVAEIATADTAGASFFEACGFAPEAEFTDWIRDDPGADRPASDRPGADRPAGPGAARPPATAAPEDLFVLPTTVADLAANRLLLDAPLASWDRATATLLARADLLQGLALATVDRITAFVLYRPAAGGVPGGTIDALGPLPEPRESDDEGRVSAFGRLLELVRERIAGPLLVPRIAEAEIPAAWLRQWGFRPVAGWRRFVAMARAG
jgi:GNAT superfamily N-acetyltransferase